MGDLSGDGADPAGRAGDQDGVPGSGRATPTMPNSAVMPFNP
ncbi:hypothetical protein ACFSTI_15985 [Rhizorhabdus histidinilytica]